MFVSQIHEVILMNFKQKIIFSFLLFGIIAFSLSSLMIFKINKSNSVNEFVSKASTKSLERENYFLSFIQMHTQYLKSIENSKIVKEFLKNREYDKLNDVFVARVDSMNSILQLRVIDNSGQELVKSVRANDGSIKTATPMQLEDKSNEYYYKETKNLKDNQIYYSKIDLSYQNCITDTKDIPTLRVATPIYIDGVKHGIVILNIDIAKILKPLSKTTLYNIYLVDKDGYCLLHKDNLAHSLSRYRDKHKIKKYFNDDYQNILDNDTYRGGTFYSKKIAFDNADEMKIILEIKEFILQKNQETLKSEVFLGIVIAMILSLPFAFILSHYADKMRNRLQDKIVALNENLEKKVIEEIEKNRQKERMLLQQSKLAIMGEMISMIAHQWRQPLSSMKILVQSIEFKNRRGVLTDEHIKESVDDTSVLIDHLSKTIDDFRDFFKPNKSKEVIEIKYIAKEALGFLAHTLSMNGIKIHTDCQIQRSVYIYKRELLQVFMNIINNAKDALLSSNPDTKEVYLKGIETEDSVIVTIEDTAGGIPAHIIDKVFDPYFSTKCVNGTGLGLYMSKVIIDTHLNGMLSVENSDKGAIFKIELPIVND
jgi:signal transduction histidine kinase